MGGNGEGERRRRFGFAGKQPRLLDTPQNEAPLLVALFDSAGCSPWTPGTAAQHPWVGASVKLGLDQSCARRIDPCRAIRESSTFVWFRNGAVA